MLTAVYFVASLLLLFCVVGIIKPRLYSVTMMLVGAVPFIMVSLVTPQLILLGLLLAGVLAYHGAFTSLLGQLGLLLHVVSWTLLVGYQLRMRTAFPILDGQPILDDEDPFPALLHPEQGGTPTQAKPQAPFAISYLPSLTLQTAARQQVEVVRDVVYREIDGVRLKLDIYRRRGQATTGRSVIYIHGGAWIVGSRRQSPFLLSELAAAGFVVFAIQYRLAPRFPLPAAITDCKAAVAWVRENAERYGGTKEAVAIGGSAGGHLTAMLAVSPGEPRLQPGFESKDTSIAGAIVLYGIANFVGIFEEYPNPLSHYLFEELVFKKRYLDDPELYRLSQPLTYLHPKVPPILLVHGENDSLIPIEEARNFLAHLQAAGVTRVHLCEIPLAPHAFELMPTPLHQRAVRIVRDFIRDL